MRTRSETDRTPRRLALALLAVVGGLVVPFASSDSGGLARGDGAPGWEALAVGAPGPDPRWDHTLAADETGERLLVFGGRDHEGTPLGDTWIYDLGAAAWEPVAGPAPAPRFGHAVAVDPGARRVYLFAGQAGATFFNDLWVFDLATDRWSEIDPGAGPRPPLRYGTSAVLDGEGHLLVSHGFTDTGRFDDTWSFDLATGVWTDVSPAADGARPLKRCLHEAVWDAANARMLLFGGCSSGFGPCPQGDLWSFDPASRAWTDLTPADGAPGARSNPALVADAANERAILFGGIGDGGYLGDLWTVPLDDTRSPPAWRAVGNATGGPGPRASHDAVLLEGKMYLFGGSTPEATLADLWRLTI